MYDHTRFLDSMIADPKYHDMLRSVPSTTKQFIEDFIQARPIGDKDQVVELMGKMCFILGYVQAKDPEWLSDKIGKCHIEDDKCDPEE